MADVMLCALACPHCPPSTGAVVLVGGGITGADIGSDAAAGCLVCGKKVPPGDAAASLEAAYMGWAMTRQALLSLVRCDATRRDARGSASLAVLPLFQPCLASDEVPCIAPYLALLERPVLASYPYLAPHSSPTCCHS